MPTCGASSGSTGARRNPSSRSAPIRPALSARTGRKSTRRRRPMSRSTTPGTRAASTGRPDADMTMIASIVTRQVSMTRIASRVLRLAALAGIVAGCEGSNGVTGIEQDPDDIFWSLALNQRAINLALDQMQPQFYTYQLVATPLRRDGTPIADAGTPTFVSADTNRVHVSATGLITARGVTSTPVRVIASMSGRPGPVTNADTAWVTVTSTVRPVASFSIRPVRTSFGIGYDTMLVAKATNAVGAAVTGLR